MDSNSGRPHDEGTGYGHRPSTFDADLALVGPGAKMGELLRRYWHPVGLTSDATIRPRQLRVLGEDLVLFRDTTGRPGLVWARCAHRGTTLYYGKVDARGIRCCYHGWLFDVEGHCLEQPGEPNGGDNRHKIRQPWYPVQELYGLIFAHMGPPSRKPLLPRYDALEQCADGEWIEADDTSIGSGGPVIANCNWLQHWENVVDPYHVVVLHGSFSGTQFSPLMDQVPVLQKFEATPVGVMSSAVRRLPDGGFVHGVTEVVMPTLRVVPTPTATRFAQGRRVPVESIGWTLPIDDTHYRIYTAGRVGSEGQLRGIRSRQNGKLWAELTPEEHQLYPGDYEAQRGQGPITLHSDERLATTDRGVTMLRRFLRMQLARLERGEDPAGLIFDEDEQPVRLRAGRMVLTGLPDNW